MNILFIADIFGRPGREAVRGHLPQIIEEENIDLCIANVENAAGRNGVTPSLAYEFFRMGIHVLTSGNHIWDQKETLDFITSEKRLLRPQNLIKGSPGEGFGIF